MAQQIKKKFIKPDAIDGLKIKLLQDQSLRGTDSLGQEVDLLKLDAQDKVLVKGEEVALKSQVDAADEALQTNIESEANRAIAVEGALQTQIDTEKGRIDAILLASEADKDSFAEIVSLINSIDTENDQAFASYVLSNDERVQDVEDGLAQEILDRQTADNNLQTQIGSVQSDISALDLRVDALEAFDYQQIVHVSKNGLDTNTGKQHSPFLTITAAMNSITDASPTKRYAIKVAPGNYTETSVALKANVFIISDGQKEAVRITGAVSMGPSFTANSSFDNRSGFANVTLLSAADFNWNTVQSAAGKLYFSNVVFGSTVNMYGYNNAIAQAQFSGCQIFGNFTVSGINVGVFHNNICFSSITLNQHPNGGMATILVATGGHCNGTITQNASVNDFNRRSASFLRSFVSEKIVLNGPAVYADVDLISQGKQLPEISNNANLVAFNPRINHDLTTQMIVPKATNSHNMGDWGKQWTWNFGYVHASTGTDLFLISYPESYTPDSAGKSIGIYTDGAGLQNNVDGGSIELATATTTGTGVRGKITLNGREIDVTNKQIKNLADGIISSDAVNKGQLDASVLVEQLARQAADAALDTRISALETQVDGPTFHKMKIVIDESSELSYVDLDHNAIANSLVVAVGRLMAHKDEDFTVTVVSGKTRLTWVGAFASGGEEAIDLEDTIFVTYAVDV